MIDLLTNILLEASPQYQLPLFFLLLFIACILFLIVSVPVMVVLGRFLAAIARASGEFNKPSKQHKDHF
jgi:hypothetical protein